MPEALIIGAVRTPVGRHGGVSANKMLRNVMKSKASVPVYWPPLWPCTDNAAMIGAAAHFRFLAGHRAGWALDIDPNLKLVD